MKSLFIRILITLVVTFLVSSLAVLLISGYIARHAMGDFIEGSMKLELQQAQRIYQDRGPQALGKYLAETDQALRGQRFFTDANGSDLISGVDRSSLRETGFTPLGFPKQDNGRFIVVSTSSDRRYRLVMIAPPPLSLVRFAPYFLLVTGIIALIGWTLSTGIVSPLHRVAAAVERFGRGDLSARVQSSRTDEIGRLARAFNGMAERIETLLTAERRLLQDVSHELRSPLARLSFAAELMKESQDPNAAAARIRREVDRLTSLVSTLIEMTSAEGDPASRKVQRVDIVDLIKEIIQDCDLEAQAHGVRVDADLPSSTFAEGDPELLRRAVENVLRNSIRYSPAQSQITLKVTTQSGDIAIAVRDRGPGVPEDKLERIFDPFFRVNESRDGSDRGVGLGLSIARRAILLHHGHIKATNANPGLEVDVRIPTIPE